VSLGSRAKGTLCRCGSATALRCWFWDTEGMRRRFRLTALTLQGTSLPLFPWPYAPHPITRTHTHTHTLTRYAPYNPSLIRLERVANFRIANIMTQTAGNSVEKRCGIFKTGFAGSMYDPTTWRSILEIASDSLGNFSTPPLQWPCLYARGNLGPPSF